MDTPAAAIWCAPDHAPGLARIVRDAGLDPAAIGAADPKAIDVAAVDAGMEGSETRVFDDLRATLLAEKPRVVLMTAPPGDPPLDGRTIADLRAAGTQILTSVCPASGLLEASELGLLKDTGGQNAASGIRLVPRIRRHPAFVTAGDLFEDFGRPAMVTIECVAPTTHGGLGAALLLAIDAAITLIGVPELADAAANRPTKRLAELDGSLAALLRFPDGRCGQITASDRGAWGWRVTLSGELGRLTIRPSGFDWIDANGERRDQTRIDEASGGYAGVLGSVLRAAASGSLTGEPAADWAGLLATADALLLSSRTGQPESPGTMLRASAASGV